MRGRPVVVAALAFLAGVLWAPPLGVALALVALGGLGLWHARVGWVAAGTALALVGAGALAVALERAPEETVLAALDQARARGGLVNARAEVDLAWFRLQRNMGLEPTP